MAAAAHQHAPGRPLVDAAPLFVAAPLRVEQRAVTSGVGVGARVVRAGMGPRRSAARARAWSTPGGGGPAPGAAFAVVGFGAGVGAGMQPSDVVVATEVRCPDGSVVALPHAGALAALVRAHAPGLRVHLGPIAGSTTLVRGAARLRLRESGVAAVDMESPWLLPAAGPRPAAVLRVVTDTAEQELLRPGLVSSGPRAYRALRRASGALVAWAQSVGGGHNTLSEESR